VCRQPLSPLTSNRPGKSGKQSPPTEQDLDMTDAAPAPNRTRHHNPSEATLKCCSIAAFVHQLCARFPRKTLARRIPVLQKDLPMVAIRHISFLHGHRPTKNSKNPAGGRVFPGRFCCRRFLRPRRGGWYADTVSGGGDRWGARYAWGFPASVRSALRPSPPAPLPKGEGGLRLAAKREGSSFVGILWKEGLPCDGAVPAL
jgi:hypothetical protein